VDLLTTIDYNAEPGRPTKILNCKINYIGFSILRIVVLLFYFLSLPGMIFLPTLKIIMMLLVENALLHDWDVK
jgi:hypothetical protein